MNRIHFHIKNGQPFVGGDVGAEFIRIGLFTRHVEVVGHDVIDLSPDTFICLRLK
jgi:hypothetical protein